MKVDKINNWFINTIITIRNSINTDLFEDHNILG